jgi:hypothetical protein
MNEIHVLYEVIRVVTVNFWKDYYIQNLRIYSDTEIYSTSNEPNLNELHTNINVFLGPKPIILCFKDARDVPYYLTNI